MIRTDEEMEAIRVRRVRNQEARKRMLAITRILKLNHRECESEAYEQWCDKKASEAIASMKTP